MLPSDLPPAQAGLVFFATLAVDYAWTKYITASAAKLAHSAAFWSMAIILLGAFSVVSYTQNHWMLLPASLGAYAGTYLAVWREKRKASARPVEGPAV